MRGGQWVVGSARAVGGGVTRLPTEARTESLEVADSKGEILGDTPQPGCFAKESVSY